MRIHVLGPILMVHRFSSLDEAVLLFHFGETQKKEMFPFPAGEWTKMLDSGDSRWLGPGSHTVLNLVSKEAAGKEVLLGPHSAVLFYRRAPNPNC
jgi:hypothetical protein